MSQTASYAPLPLSGCVVLVVDATTGLGRILTTRLCAAGAAVAVVGAGHPGRADDAATNAAFLSKELTDIGLVALPYQAGIERVESFGSLPRQIAADLGPVAASIVVIPSGPGTEHLAKAFRSMSAMVAASLPAGAEHIEIHMAEGTDGHEGLAHAVVGRLLETDRKPAGNLPTIRRL